MKTLAEKELDLKDQKPDETIEVEGTKVAVYGLKLAAQAGHRLLQLRRGITECVECGAKGPHETNGELKLYDLSLSCTECGEHMDATDILDREGLLGAFIN